MLEMYKLTRYEDFALLQARTNGTDLVSSDICDWSNSELERTAWNNSNNNNV